MNFSPRAAQPVGVHDTTLLHPPTAEPGKEFDSVTVLGPPPSPAVIAALSGLAQSAHEIEARGASESRELPEYDRAGPETRSWLAHLRARVEDDFRRAPRSMRLLLFALPIVAWAALGFGRPAPEPARPTKPPAPFRAPTTAHAPHVAADPAPPPRGPAPVSNVMRGKRTLEASAADAAARGAYPEALALYRELAQMSPNRPEFASAVRILQSKHGRR